MKSERGPEENSCEEGRLPVAVWADIARVRIDFLDYTYTMRSRIEKTRARWACF